MSNNGKQDFVEYSFDKMEDIEKDLRILKELGFNDISYKKVTSPVDGVDKWVSQYPNYMFMDFSKKNSNFISKKIVYSIKNDVKFDKDHADSIVELLEEDAKNEIETGNLNYSFEVDLVMGKASADSIRDAYMRKSAAIRIALSVKNAFIATGAISFASYFMGYENFAKYLMLPISAIVLVGMSTSLIKYSKETHSIMDFGWKILKEDKITG